jgi:hypothetical protein
VYLIRVVSAVGMCRPKGRRYKCQYY